MCPSGDSRCSSPGRDRALKVMARVTTVGQGCGGEQSQGGHRFSECHGRPVPPTPQHWLESFSLVCRGTGWDPPPTPPQKAFWPLTFVCPVFSLPLLGLTSMILDQATSWNAWPAGSNVPEQSKETINSCWWIGRRVTVLIATIELN